MPKLAVVGHFSTWLVVAWIGWLLWAAWQIVWYRRLRSADESAVPSSRELEPAVTPEPPAERTATLRAPGIPLRTMTPAAAPRTPDQPPADAAAEPPAETPADDINPS